MAKTSFSIKKELVEPKIYTLLKSGLVKSMKTNFYLDIESFNLSLDDFSFRVRTKLPKNYYFQKFNKDDFNFPFIFPGSIYKMKYYSKKHRNDYTLSLHLFGKNLSEKMKGKCVSVKILTLKPLIFLVKLQNGRGYKIVNQVTQVKIYCYKILKALFDSFEWQTKNGNELSFAHALILMDLKDWNLELNKIFIKTQTELEIAIELINRKLIIGKCPEKFTPFTGDIIIFDNNLQPLSSVEVTKYSPTNHEPHGGTAKSRLYNLLKATMLNYTKSSFLILQKPWEQRLRYEKNFLESKNVYLIYTNFGENWQKDVVDSIQLKLSNAS